MRSPDYERQISVVRLRAFTIISVLACGGCQPPAEISRYQAPKDQLAPVSQSSRDGTSPTDQPVATTMLVAIVNQDSKVWFLKVTGPTDQMASRKPMFREFVGSVTFEAGEPKWKLPEGWQEKPGSGMRFATLNTGQPGLDLSVIALPAPQPLLANVNRWRGQLQLPAVSEAELQETTEQIELTNAKAFVFELLGTASGGQPNRGPLMASPSATGPESRDEPTDIGFEYAKPDTWQPGRLGPMRKLAFEVTLDDKQAELTVTTLSAAGGAVKPNVDRWRRQVGLPPAENDDGIQEIQLSGEKAVFVALMGPEDSKSQVSTLGAITIRGNTAWFFKLMGDTKVVSAERENFESFLRSVKFADK